MWRHLFKSKLVLSKRKENKKIWQDNQRLKVCCNSNYHQYIGYSKYFKKDKQLKIYVTIKTFPIDNAKNSYTRNNEFREGLLMAHIKPKESNKRSCYINPLWYNEKI